MMIEVDAHPELEQIRRYGQGRLAADEAQAVEEHVALCDDCCRLLESVPADSFMGRLQRLDATTPRSPMAAEDVVAREFADHPRYRVIRLLGRGGMGAVFLAEHRQMNRPVALKVLRTDLLDAQGSLARFRQEVRAAAQLDHPNIVAAYDADQVGALTFLVMEYVEGENLADYLAQTGPLPVAEACEVARQAALGLQHAHDRGMVHRDIKPHNLMRSPSGRVKVLDFGLARFAAEPSGAAVGGGETAVSHLTSAGAVMGTADYVAPEQVSDTHGADGRADMYSLGCTLYQLLSGRPPFTADTTSDKLRSHSVEKPCSLRELRSDVPEALAAVIDRMMAKRPEDRYPTATEAATALIPFTTITSRFHRAQKQARSRWRIFVALAALIFVTFGLLLAAGVVKLPVGPDREIIIETSDPGIEVIVKGDRIVRIVDPKTGKAYKLDRADLTLSTDDPDGLAVVLDGERPIVLKRQRKQFARVRLERKRGGPSGEEVVEAPASADGIREVQRFEGIPGKHVESVAISHDGRQLLTAAGALRVHEISTGKVLKTLKSSDPIVSVAVSFDGKYAISGGIQTVKIWNLATGEVMSEWKTGQRVKAWQGTVLPGCVAFSLDGRHAYSASFNGDVVKWEVATGKSVQLFQDAIIPSMAVSGLGRRLAIIAEPPRWAPSDGITRVRVFDVSTEKEIRAIPISTPNDGIGFPGLSLSPDERAVAWGANDYSIRVWDVDADREAMRLPFVKGAPIHALAFSPDGRCLLATNANGYMKLWDLRSRKPIAEHTAGGIRAVAFTPDGRHVVAGHFDGHTRLYRLPDVPSPETVGEEPPDATTQAEPIAPLRRVRLPNDKIQAFPSISPNGRYFQATHGSITRVWETESGKLVLEKPGMMGHFPPDSTQIVLGACSSLNDFQVHDLATGTLVRAIDTRDQMYRFWISPKGTRLYYNTPNTMQVWDWETGKRLFRIPWNYEVDGSFVLWAPDGLHLLVQPKVGAHYVLDGATGKKAEAYTQLRDLPDDFNRFLFSHDKLVFGTGSKLKILQAATAEQIATFEGGPQARGRLSADGRRLLATCNQRDELWLWDVATRKPLARLHASDVEVACSDFHLSADGCYAVLFGPTAAAIVFRLPAPAPEKVGEVQRARVDRVAYDKNHSYQGDVDFSSCVPCDTCQHINYAPVFVNPTTQWSTPKTSPSCPSIVKK